LPDDKTQPIALFQNITKIIRLAVIMYVRFPLSRRNVEDLMHERGIDISHETGRFWWNRFGPLFAAEIRIKRVEHLRAQSNWQWNLDEVFAKINGETHYLWRAVDHEGEVLESYVTKHRDCKAALKFLRKKNEALWFATCHRDRPTAVLRRRDEGHWQSGKTGNWALGKQSSRELTLAVSTTRTSNVALQANTNLAKVCRRTRLSSQPFQPRKTSLQLIKFQAEPRRRSG
jgi:hypothetical protein